MAENNQQQQQQSEGVSKKDFEDLKTLVTDIAKANKALADNVRSLGEGMTEISMRFAKGDDEEGGGGNREEEAAIDYERLTNTQMIQLMGNTVDQKLGKLNTMLEEKFGKVNNEMIATDLKKQVDVSRGLHKDFDKWTDTMKTLFTENPYLKVEDAYQLARSRNPERAKEIDTEMEKLQAGDDGSAVNSKRPFGGLTPTSRGSAEGEGEAKYKTFEEAAGAAWDEVMSDVAVGEDQLV